MENNVNLIAFGTFGSPNGFTQTSFTGNPSVEKKIKNFDIRGAISITEKSTLYSIRKENSNGDLLVSYSKYSYAQEPTSARGGSFIGVSILFSNQLAQENITVNILEEFHKTLVENNIQDGIIKVNHSDKFSVLQPKDFDKIKFNLKEINQLYTNQISNKNLVVYCRTNENSLKKYFEESINLLNIYDIIYFSESKEVLDFVHQKGILKTVDEEGFKIELDKVEEKRKQEIQIYLQELEKSKNDFENDRKLFEEKFKKQIEQNEIKHTENEKLIQDSKLELNNINVKYSDFLMKIDTLISKLKNNEKLEVIKSLYTESKNVLDQELRDKKGTQLISSIRNSNISTNQRVLNHQNNINYDDLYNNTKKTRKSKSYFFEMLSSFLGVVIIGMLAYFFLFYEEEKQVVTTFSTPAESYSEPSEQDMITIDNILLKPTPNSEVEITELKKMNEKLIKGSKIDSVIAFVLKANPSSINEYYKHQKSDYKKLLLEKNSSSFNITTQDTIYVDTLKVVPNFNDIKR
ncbi:hypothetical protein [Empedobacter stercoris]|uniref:hypothetical protein n=1 Tax=Empedobacter stercoris TaxID=1628248 RepID=UPI0039ED0610